MAEIEEETRNAKTHPFPLKSTNTPKRGGAFTHALFLTSY